MAKLYVSSDRGFYRNDRKVFLDGNCSELSELPGDVITISSDCTINILLMCNGVVNCDDCVDEVSSNCMRFECPEGTRQ